MKIKDNKVFILISVFILIFASVLFIYYMFLIPRPALKKLNIRTDNISSITIIDYHNKGKKATIYQDEIPQIIEWLNYINIKYYKDNTDIGGGSFLMLFNYNEENYSKSIVITNDNCICDRFSKYKIVGQKLNLDFLYNFY